MSNVIPYRVLLCLLTGFVVHAALLLACPCCPLPRRAAPLNTVLEAKLGEHWALALAQARPAEQTEQAGV